MNIDFKEHAGVIWMAKSAKTCERISKSGSVMADDDDFTRKTKY